MYIQHRHLIHVNSHHFQLLQDTMPVRLRVSSGNTPYDKLSLGIALILKDSVHFDGHMAEFRACRICVHSNVYARIA